MKKTLIGITRAFSKMPQVKLKFSKDGTYKVVNRFGWLKVCAAVMAAIIAIGAFKYTSVIVGETYRRISYLSNDIRSSVTGSALSNAIASIIHRDGGIDMKLANTYAKWIMDSATKWSIDPMTILAVMAVESKFDYTVVSSGNAVGLMQIIHTWHKEKAEKGQLLDPQVNIDVGAQILSEYKKISSTEAEALLRYNGSLGGAGGYAAKVLMKKAIYKKQIVDQITT